MGVRVVVGACAEEEMVWVRASRHIAAVKYPEPIHDWAAARFVGPPMRTNRSTARGGRELRSRSRQRVRARASNQAPPAASPRSLRAACGSGQSSLRLLHFLRLGGRLLALLFDAGFGSLLLRVLLILTAGLNDLREHRLGLLGRQQVELDAQGRRLPCARWQAAAEWTGVPAGLPPAAPAREGRTPPPGSACPVPGAAGAPEFRQGLQCRLPARHEDARLLG